MRDDRGTLVSQLVRTQALLWSSESPTSKQRLRDLIRQIEARIAALDRGEVPPPARPAPAPKPGTLRR